MEHPEPSEEHLKVLKEKFRCKSFKKDQWKAIRSIMYDRKDTSIVASTGFGKSLIYQYPPVFLNQITFVISPLIALMQDQVQSLTERGIKATYFCSVQTDRKIPEKFGQFNVVYVTPESLLREGYTATQVQNGIKKIVDRICMFAIDEAHVVQAWKDFRGVFTELYKLRDMYPGIPIVTLTATCPIYVEKTIRETLKLQDPFSLRTTLNRPNLYFEAHRKRKGVDDFLPYIKNHTEGNAIVYVISRKEAEGVAEKLAQHGIESKPYHSKIHASERTKTLIDFRSGTLKIVVCTIAFGMGIDRRDVRLVIHYGMPRTIEGYYQEAGRAGRDGKKSKCVMFYSAEDYDTQSYFIKNPNFDDKKPNPKPVSPEFQREQFGLLDKMREFAQSRKCRRIEMLKYLGSESSEHQNLTINEECCDNCARDCSGRGNIALNLIFKDIDDDNCYDYTDYLRRLLKCLNQHQSEPTFDILIGSIPSAAKIAGCDLTFFGSGRDKPKDFWDALHKLATRLEYCSGQKLTAIGKKFIRNNLETCLTKPSKKLYKFLEKDTEIEFFWNGDDVDLRSVYSDSEEEETDDDQSSQESNNSLTDEQKMEAEEMIKSWNEYVGSGQFQRDEEKFEGKTGGENSQHNNSEGFIDSSEPLQNMPTEEMTISLTDEEKGMETKGESSECLKHDNNSADGPDFSYIGQYNLTPSQIEEAVATFSGREGEPPAKVQKIN